MSATKARRTPARSRPVSKRVSTTMRVSSGRTTVEFDGRRVPLGRYPGDGESLIEEAAAWLDGLECYHLEDMDGRRVFKGSDGRFYAVEFVGVLVECRPAKKGKGYLFNVKDEAGAGKGYEVIGEVRVE